MTYKLLVKLFVGVTMFLTVTNAIGRDKEKEYTREDIEPYIQSMMNEGDIPGLSLVIIEGEKQMIKTYGYADLDDQISVTPETLFEIASCSKAFTGLAVTVLEREGLLDITDNVRDYLPWFRPTYEDQEVDISIKDLLHHTSGIPWSTISKIPQTTEANALELTVRSVAEQELREPPGKEFEYATINYDILALIIEKVTGQVFESYLQERIINPLGLEQTSIGQPSDQKLMATGHKVSFFEAREYEAPRFKGNNAAGYVISNAKDMATWLKFQLGHKDLPLYQSAKETHQSDQSVAIHGMQYYARGWEVALDGSGMIYHAGLNPNFSAYVAFRKDKNLAVAVMSNSNSYFAHAIGDRIMKILGEVEIEEGAQPGDQGDQKFSMATFALFLYCLVVFGYICWIFYDIVKKKRKYRPLKANVLVRSFRTLIILVPIIGGIYLIPQAMDDFSWSAILVWTPLSFEWFIKMILISIALSYFAYIFSMIFPEPNEYRRRIPQILLMSIISGLSNVVIIIMVTTSLDVEEGLEYLIFYYAIALCLYLFGRRFVQISLVKFTRGMVYDLRIQLIQKIFSTSYENFEKIERGRVYTSINEDVNTIGHSTDTIVTLITNVITTIGAFVFLAAIASWATFLTILLILTLATIYYFVSQSTNKYYEQARDTRNTFMSLINGMIDGFKEISLKKNKKLEYKSDVSDSANEFRDKVSTADIKFVDAFLVGESLLVVLLGAVGFGMSKLFPAIEFYTIVSFVIILLYLIGPINVILGSVPSLVQLRIAWNRVKGFIDEIPATLELNQPRKSMEETVESFKIKNLTYQYPEREGVRSFGVGPIDLEVQKGEILFIIGGNGSGKTTLAKLLVGLYTARNGEILINDRLVNAEEIGEYYSTVFSPAHLFKKLYNIDVESKRDEIDKYLKILNLEDKVTIQNNEFSTIDLSGGQRKRLALLQCYLEDSPIYLFDEWAADQDPEYRKFFYRTLLPEMKKSGKIVIAITHDDHYFDVADRVVKMNNGKLEDYSKVLVSTL